MLSPRIAAHAATAMTISMLRCPREARMPAVKSAVSPGSGMPIVSIELEDNVLTVSGERKAEHEEKKEGFYRVERSYGQFRRSLTLPEGVDADAIAATFDKGVLEVRIPKPEERKPRKVAIQVGDRAVAIEGSETAS